MKVFNIYLTIGFNVKSAVTVPITHVLRTIQCLRLTIMSQSPDVSKRSFSVFQFLF